LLFVLLSIAYIHFPTHTLTHSLTCSLLRLRSTTHGKIATEAEGLQLSRTIATRAAAAERDDDVILMRSSKGRENHLHTPPMLFPHDSLVLAYDPPEGVGVGVGECESERVQTRVEFNVLDALSCWAVQHRAEQLAAFIPEVPYAHKWQPQSQSQSQQQATTTATTATTATSEVKEKTSSESSSGSKCDPVDMAAMQVQEWDWTFR
jgi:hypothetical protein